MLGIRRGLSLILLLASLMVILPGCGHANDYKVFALTVGIAHFSFEYPARYHIDGFSSADTALEYDTYVWLSCATWSPPKGDPILPEVGHLDFQLFATYPGGAHPPDSTAQLESDLSLATKDVLDFKLLDRLPVTVAGAHGEEVVYSRTRPWWPLGPERRTEPTTTICRVAYFGCAGRIWRLYMEYDTAKQKQAEADFEHILQTFKILD